MAEFRGYFLVENLGLTDAQRATLVDGLKTLGVRNLSIYPIIKMIGAGRSCRNG